jgi:hypothetical protein
MDEKMTWLSTWQHFPLEEFSRGQVSWATSNPQARNSTFREFQLEAKIMILHFPSCPPYHLFSQIIFLWTEILDRPVHFITVVQAGPLSFFNYPNIEGKWPRTYPEGDVATWVECGRMGQCSKQSDNCVLSMKV